MDGIHLLDVDTHVMDEFHVMDVELHVMDGIHVMGVDLRVMDEIHVMGVGLHVMDELQVMDVDIHIIYVDLRTNESSFVKRGLNTSAKKYRPRSVCAVRVRNFLLSQFFAYQRIIGHIASRFIYLLKTGEK